MEDRYLFRAKSIDNGEWVQGCYIYDVERGCSESLNKFAHRIQPLYAQAYAEPIDPSTLCQCTGLRDKNNNLIWENDIIHKPFYTDYDAYANSEAYTGRIQYEDGGWSVEITKPDGNVCVSPIIEMIAYSKDIEYCEIIGNIFDNPELINKREKTYCKDSNDYER